MNNPFNIIGNAKANESGQEAKEVNVTTDLNERIKGLISSADVFLFMKGNADFPQCGFSSNVVGILNHLNINFKTFDILSDEAIRQGVKDFSKWPTFPQLYLKGQMLGGNDIITEMMEGGELQEVLAPFKRV